SLARDLGLKKGERVALHLKKISAAPRETFLGKRGTSDVLTTLNLPVADVLPEDDFASAFSLNPGPATPRNAYLPLAVLQEELHDMEEADEPARNLPQRPVNAVLAGGSTRAALQLELRRQLRLQDWGLDVR